MISAVRTIEGWRRVVEWVVIIAALIYAVLFARFGWGGAAAYVLAMLPCVLAVLVARTLLAGAFMFMLPMYFVIGQATAGWPHWQPVTAIDRVMPLWPAWIFVYASLYMCAFLLPLVVVRSRELFLQALKAYLLVMVVSYAGFLVYPTVAPRDESLAVSDFSTWLLRLFYDLDQPYGCFPSLHVAYSFVGALVCYRVHRRVGRFAAAWAVAIGVSTIYTKQHFAVDAIAGAVIGLATYPLFLSGRPKTVIDPREYRFAPRGAVYVTGGYASILVIAWAAYAASILP